MDENNFADFHVVLLEEREIGGLEGWKAGKLLASPLLHFSIPQNFLPESSTG
jgi:hypothetical protein